MFRFAKMLMKRAVLELSTLYFTVVHYFQRTTYRWEMLDPVSFQYPVCDCRTRHMLTLTIASVGIQKSDDVAIWLIAMFDILDCWCKKCHSFDTRDQSKRTFTLNAATNEPCDSFKIEIGLFIGTRGIWKYEQIPDWIRYSDEKDFVSLKTKENWRWSHFQLNTLVSQVWRVRTAAWLAVKENLQIVTWPLGSVPVHFFRHCVSSILEAMITPTMCFTPNFNVWISYLHTCIT